MKKYVLQLKRHFWFMRDIVRTLKQSDLMVSQDTMTYYLVDLDDHVTQLIDISESFRDELVDLTDRYLADVNARSNDIMKALTIVAGVFMPLTFIAGIYGMNFKVMPELEWAWRYLVVIGVMVVLSVGLIGFFKYRRCFD